MTGTIDTKLGSRASATPSASSTRARIRHYLVKLLSLLVIWQERAEQRHALGELNSHMLKDIGVTAADAYRESRKPFWIP